MECTYNLYYNLAFCLSPCCVFWDIQEAISFPAHLYAIIKSWEAFCRAPTCIAPVEVVIKQSVLLSVMSSSLSCCFLPAVFHAFIQLVECHRYAGEPWRDREVNGGYGASENKKVDTLTGQRFSIERYWSIHLIKKKETWIRKIDIIVKVTILVNVEL